MFKIHHEEGRQPILEVGNCRGHWVGLHKNIPRFRFYRTPRLVSYHWFLTLGPFEIWCFDGRAMTPEEIHEIEAYHELFWAKRAAVRAAMTRWQKLAEKVEKRWFVIRWHTRRKLGGVAE